MITSVTTRVRVAPLARFHMNGPLLFKRTIEQKTGTIPLAPKTVELEAYETCYTTDS